MRETVSLVLASALKTDALPIYAKMFLLFLAAVNLVLGLLFYIGPSAMIPYWSWSVKDLAVRFLGAIFLAISLGCLSGVLAKS